MNLPGAWMPRDNQILFRRDLGSVDKIWSVLLSKWAWAWNDQKGSELSFGYVKSTTFTGSTRLFKRPYSIGPKTLRKTSTFFPLSISFAATHRSNLSKNVSKYSLVLSNSGTHPIVAIFFLLFLSFRHPPLFSNILFHAASVYRLLPF